MVFHDYLTLIIPSIIGFVFTIIAAKFLMGYMMESGVTSPDHNKKGRPTLPAGVGLSVAIAFSIGILTYAFGVSAHIYGAVADLTYLFATVLSIILISMVGLLDDINVKKEMVKSTDMMDTRKGLKQWYKPLMTIMGALPLMAVINSTGLDTLLIPFIGQVNFGLIYPLVIIPLAIIFTSNAFNLLGGFDGIATGTGFLASLALLIYALVYGNYIGALLASVLTAVLFAFLFFNIYPAKAIPGDSFTYGVGAALLVIMALGNMEIFGIIVFMPWIIEFILHLRRKFQVTDLGKMNSDGTFAPPYGKKIYSWTHLIMNIKRCREWEVSLYMWVVEILFILLAFGLKALSVI